MKIKDLESCPALLEESPTAKRVGLDLYKLKVTKGGNGVPNNFNPSVQITIDMLKSQAGGYAQNSKGLTTA